MVGYLFNARGNCCGYAALFLVEQSQKHHSLFISLSMMKVHYY